MVRIYNLRQISVSLTKFGMYNIIFLVDVYGVVPRVIHYAVEINTLMWCCLIYDRLSIYVCPHVCYNGYIGSTSSAHTQNFETVLYPSFPVSPENLTFGSDQADRISLPLCSKFMLISFAVAFGK